MYEKAIVSFIDILGFRELIDRSSAEEVRSILEKVHQFTKPIIESPEDEDFEAEAISFSDSIVRVRKTERGLNSEYPIGLVYYELKDLFIAQAALISQGILVRGGIAYGDIYFCDGHLYGPALNHAYELEAYYAVYPRIVLSPGLIEETKNNHLMKDEERTHEQELEVIHELIGQADDGLWFIDYINTVQITEPDEVPGYLLKHKQTICEGAQQFNEMNRRLSKYLWMAKYHNDFIKNIPDRWFSFFQTNRKNFTISTEELTALQDMNIGNSF